jgi:hypothetical protein
MTIKVTELPNEPIMLCEVISPYKPVEDTKTVQDAAYALYERVKGPIYSVSYSLEDIQMSFPEAIVSFAAGTRGERRLNGLPLTMYLVLDSDSAVMKSMMAAVARGMYGGIDVKLAKNKDEALAMIRASLA